MRSARKVAVLPGAFNPPTVAHLALLEAASKVVDQTLCILPRQYPHKIYHGATLPQRLEMLQTLGCQVATADAGLFIDIARELRQREIVEPDTQLAFLCGRDTAERIVNWDYTGTVPIQRQLEEYTLLVARRQGVYTPPPDLAHRIEPLDLDLIWDEVSSTGIREALAAGDRDVWQAHVPQAILPLVESIYGGVSSPESRTRRPLAP